MTATKIVGVMGSGLIGSDPYEENGWSGSSRHFFAECQRQGLLHRAFGIEVERTRRLPLMLRNFSFDRDRWRQKFYLDTTYYDLLSRRMARALSTDPREHGVLQIGGIYHLRPLVHAGRPIFSYHDGNLAQALRSPAFPRGVSARRIQQALDYEKRVYQSMNLIFTMSRYLKRSFVDDFGIDERKVRVVGAGINLDAVPPPAQKKRYDAKKVLFVGADFERKGGTDLLLAFRKVRTAHPTAELQIVGPRRLVIPLELSAGVTYSGFLSKTNPVERRAFQRILEDATVFVMPSRYEPFGIAPLEAMAFQIPPVLTDAWAFPEIVTPGVTGELVRNGDPADLAEKLVGLLEDPDRLERMGRAGRELVLRQYTWTAVVTKLREEIPAHQSANGSQSGLDGEIGGRGSAARGHAATPPALAAPDLSGRKRCGLADRAAH